MRKMSKKIDQNEAQAMKYALDKLVSGEARIERSDSATSLVEFCFRGIRTIIGSRWVDTVDIFMRHS